MFLANISISCVISRCDYWLDWFQFAGD